MPTILTAFGIRLFFYSSDSGEPLHVHVAVGRERAKFWIADNDSLRLAERSKKMKDVDLKHAKQLIRDNVALIREKWDAHFGS